MYYWPQNILFLLWYKHEVHPTQKKLWRYLENASQHNLGTVSSFNSAFTVEDTTIMRLSDTIYF